MFIYVFLLIAAALSCALTPLVRYAARCVGAVDQPGGARFTHTTSRRGQRGRVGVLTVLIVWGLEHGTAESCGVSWESWKPVCFGGAIVFLLGVWDDVRPIPAGVKFVLQGVAAGVAIWGGILVEHVSLLGGSHIDLGALALPLTFCGSLALRMPSISSMAWMGSPLGWPSSLPDRLRRSFSCMVMHRIRCCCSFCWAPCSVSAVQLQSGQHLSR